MKDLFEIVPMLGYWDMNCKKFHDKELFDSHYHNFIVLSKIKLWYGTSFDNSQPALTNKSSKFQGKYILGIQCEYKNGITGEKKTTDMYCGTLNSNDIETGELELVDGDYIKKFYICYYDIISYIEFQTKKGKKLSFGEFDKNSAKTLQINNEEPAYMLQSFHGCYDEFGLRALGCSYMKRKNYYILNLFDVFRLRHKFKKEPNEKEKWSSEEEMKKLNIFEKAFLKVCLLPESLCFGVLQYCCDIQYV